MLWAIQIVQLADVFTAVGLVLAASGAAWAAKSVMLKEDDAISIGVPRWASEDRAENLKMPMVQNLLSASTGARWGLWLVVVGTVVQLVPLLAKPFA